MKKKIKNKQKQELCELNKNAIKMFVEFFKCKKEELKNSRFQGLKGE